MQANADTQTAIHFFNDLDQFEFAKKAVRTNHIDVALVELAISSFLRSVSPPNGLDLKALEGKNDLLTMLHHVPCKRYGEVITQSFLRSECCFLSAVLNTEKQFVAFLAVLTHEGGEVLHRRRLYLLKTK